MDLQLNTKIYTLNGTADNAETVEKLLVETGIEEEFA